MRRRNMSEVVEQYMRWNSAKGSIYPIRKWGTYKYVSKEIRWWGRGAWGGKITDRCISAATLRFLFASCQSWNKSRENWRKQFRKNRKMTCITTFSQLISDALLKDGRTRVHEEPWVIWSLFLSTLLRGKQILGSTFTFCQIPLPVLLETPPLSGHVSRILATKICY